MLAKRVVFPAANQVTIETEEVADPGAGELLVKAIVSVITAGTELTLLAGCQPEGTFWSEYGCYPVHPGFGQVGEVLGIGSGVTGFSVGDRVLCSAGHRSLSLISAAKAHLVPAEVFADEAVFHTIASGIANSIRMGQVSLGDSVAVVGLGLLGQFGVRLAKLAGARPVIGIDPRPERRELAFSGAIAALDPNAPDFRDRFATLTDGVLADVVFEMTGDASAIPMALGLVRPRGRYVQVGCPRGKTEIDFSESVVAPGLSIVGSLFSRKPDRFNLDCSWSNRRSSDLFLRLIDEGSLDTQNLVSHRFSWRDAADAYRLLATNRGRTLGVLIDWGE